MTHVIPSTKKGVCVFLIIEVTMYLEDVEQVEAKDKKYEKIEWNDIDPEIQKLFEDRIYWDFADEVWDVNINVRVLVCDDVRALVLVQNKYQYLISFRGDLLAYIPKEIKTIHDAIEYIMPDEVLLTKDRSNIKRQGEWFFIPKNDLYVPGYLIHKKIETLRQLESKYDPENSWYESADEYYTKGMDVGEITKTMGMHIAEEEFRYQNDVFVRGTVIHLTGDHEEVDLGQTWHLVRKNKARMRIIGRQID